MLNKNVVIMLFALTLAAPAAFAQLDADPSAHEQEVLTQKNKAEVGKLLKGTDTDSVTGKVRAGQEQVDQVEDATATVQTGRKGTMDTTTLNENEDFFSKAGNKPVTTVAEATKVDQAGQLRNNLKTLLMDKNAKSAGIDEKMASNILVLFKWNATTAEKIVSSVQTLLKLHGDQIAQLDSLTQAEVGEIIRDEMSVAYALGYSEARTLDVNGDVETYILNVNGSLIDMTPTEQKSYFLTLAKLDKAGRADTFRALHNKEEILKETAAKILAERKANGGRLAGGREAGIEHEVVLDMIKAHHNLSPDDPNDPTKMTEKQMTDLADEIMAKQC